MPEPSPYDFGDRLRRRYAAVDRAQLLVERHPGDERLVKLAGLLQEARARLWSVPVPMADHPHALALLAETHRAAVAELKRVEALLGEVAEPELVDAEAGS